jgi:hypothetical protein
VLVVSEAVPWPSGASALGGDPLVDGKGVPGIQSAGLERGGPLEVPAAVRTGRQIQPIVRRPLAWAARIATQPLAGRELGQRPVRVAGEFGGEGDAGGHAR